MTAGQLLPVQEALIVSDSEKVRDRLAEIIHWHATHHPRHLQKELGPSEIGHPCTLKLALHVIDAPTCNPGFDVLPSEIGVGYHDRLQRHFDAENERIGTRRWLTETRVEPWPGLTGSCDLFDVEEAQVIDWKILGDASMRKLRSRGPKTSYARQLQLYGRGFERAGYEVRSVALAAIPKAGTLAGMHITVVDYQPAIADEVEQRWVGLLVTIDVLDVSTDNPAGLAAFERVEEDCQFCPFFSRNPVGPFQCGGPTAYSTAQ